VELMHLKFDIVNGEKKKFKNNRDLEY
jgi:hypothetical protein